jgi:dTDP-4-amino-4,6-dideoxygalactose transaminase
MNFIFNSLGSNYNLYSALYFLIANRKTQNYPKKKLCKMFNKKGLLYFSQGRHAISYALKHAKIGKDEKVLIQAFTCWAVESAVIATGAKPIFVDIDPTSLNFDVKDLTKKIRKHKPKAIIIQHTLGNPADITTIKKISKQNGVTIIEDLAHSFGNKFKEKLLGTYSNYAILSFGRDKLLDAIAGGALLTKDKIRPEFQKPEKLKLTQKLYPLITLIIRKTYFLVIGKLVHYLAKITGLFSSPVLSSKNHGPIKPRNVSHINLALSQQQKSSNHRKKITKIYQSNLSPNLQIKEFYQSSQAILRYPILVKNRSRLLEILKQEAFFLSDIWYKKPVATGSLNVSSNYKKGSCPNAQKVARHILNLPTHINLSPKKAKQLTNLINTHAQSISV